jgi:secreted trypsin-like serine protease
MRDKARVRIWVSVAVLIAVAVVIAATALGGDAHKSQPRAGIVGGVPVASTTLPALAYVRIRWQRSIAQCTGTLVAPNAILTAAHCLESSSTGNVAAAAQVRVLVGHLSDASERHPGLTIKRIIVFRGSRYPTDGADVALLVMNTPTTLSPIPLASGDRWSAAPRAEMVGWSTDELLPRAILDSQFSQPEKVIAPTVVQTSGWCEAKVWHFGARYDLCAIDPPSYSTGGCLGASGTPLVASNTLPAVEIGMLIRGSDGCSTHRPTVFIRISAVRGWIQAQLVTISTLNNNYINTDGSRY